MAVAGIGLPGGFAGDAWEIHFNSRPEDAGKTICIDSSFFPVGGRWLWAAPTVSPIVPDWSGQRCLTIKAIDDQPPQITNCPPLITGSHCNTLVHNFDGSDAEASLFTFELVSGPGVIDASTGMWSWNSATLDDVGKNIQLEIAARDGSTGILGPVCRTIVVATNSAPVIEGCGWSVAAIAGTTVELDSDGYDDCDPLSWSVAPTNGAIGALTVNTQGTITYIPDPLDAGLRTFSITLTDGRDSSSCGFSVYVSVSVPYKVTIEAIPAETAAHPGEFVDLDLTLLEIDPTRGLGGFDLLVAYEAEHLSF